MNNPSQTMTPSGKRKLDSSFKENVVNGRRQKTHLQQPAFRPPAYQRHTSYTKYLPYRPVVPGYARVYRSAPVVTPARTQNDNNNILCRGCLRGSSPTHLRYLHSVMTTAIYSSDDHDSVWAGQKAGAAFCHDGLAFFFEKDAMVIRSNVCTGHVWCPPCQEQAQRVASMFQDVTLEHSGDPKEVCKVTSLERIKLVPSLAEAQLEKMMAELQDYKENGVVVVAV